MGCWASDKNRNGLCHMAGANKSKRCWCRNDSEIRKLPIHPLHNSPSVSLPRLSRGYKRLHAETLPPWSKYMRLRAKNFGLRIQEKVWCHFLRSEMRRISTLNNHKSGDPADNTKQMVTFSNHCMIFCDFCLVQENLDEQREGGGLCRPQKVLVAIPPMFQKGERK